jgi:hypothetical protein
MAEALANQAKASEEWLKEKQQLLAQLAQLEAPQVDTVALEDHKAMTRKYHSTHQELESYKAVSDQQVSSLQKSNEELRAEVRRLVGVQKERDELSDTNSRLTEKITAMQSVSASEAGDHAKTLERFSAQYNDIDELVREKQKKVAKLAAKDTVPFDFYDNCKKEYQALHKEFESHKGNANAQICSLEEALKAEASKRESMLNADSHRVDALEKERNELSDQVATINTQLNSMRQASTSQASENTNVLEILTQQYKEAFQIVQDKQRILADLAEEDARFKESGANDYRQTALHRNKQLINERDALQDRNRALQQEH